jgi:hypothetical protein
MTIFDHMSTRLIISLLIEVENEENRMRFYSLDENKRNYSHGQQTFALSLVDIHGVRATARLLEIPRRTIQRWCTKEGKQVKRYPDWMYEWAEKKRRKREFWRSRGYY